MTDKELRRLHREDLLQILLEQQKKIEETETELDAAHRALADRHTALENVGSIAEAALALNGVFERAQAAADEYLSQAKEKADQLRQAAREEAERASLAAERTINAARVEADTILSRAQIESDRLLRQAEEALKDAQARLDAAQSPRDADAGDAPKRRFGLFGRGKKA